MKRLSLLFALAFALAGCGDQRERAESILKKVGAEPLRKDAAMMHKVIFSAPGSDFVVIRPKEWPATFQRFAPLRVGAYPDGISLTLKATSSGEAGLYVVPQSMDHTPSPTHGNHFQKLADGIYWYSFGD